VINSIAAAQAIMTYIEVKFPEGIKGFLAGQGELFFMPNTENFVIYRKDIDEKFVIDIQDHFKSGGINIVCDDISNFEGLDEVEVRGEMDRFFNFLKSINRPDIQFVATKACFALNFSGSSKSLVCEKLKKYFENSSSFRRVMIVCEDGVISPDVVCTTRYSNNPEKRKKEKLMTKEVVSERRKINDDDLLNLRINLETAQDVNDFINSL